MNKVLVIAEIGLNHNGDFGVAKSMISKAKAAGADIAKFQYYDPLKVLGSDSPFLEYATKCQFTKEQHAELEAFCDAQAIEYLVSVFDVADIDWANSLCQRHKVASRMCQSEEFRDAVLATGKPVVVSLGAPYGLLNVVGREVWSGKTVERLICVTEYPAPLNHFNRIKEDMTMSGFSNHCPSISPAIYAVSYGARVVEAHVTLDRSLPGCDQSSSWTFEQLEKFVEICRELEVIR